ncbi:unnamed protein product [Ilex paraguariensis]|uniref:Major facilitator superfamily (MFS) profile domain-containing protein n=1 Tax=Ilex paraguariensis TaxID=185542 RepID=A0ABC8S8A5_9AQUA
MASMMERADENLIPAVQKEIGEAFRTGPSDLGYLTFIRNFVEGLASPLAGMLVIRHDRPTVLALGSLCWALSTAAVGISQYFWQVAFLRAVNGVGLAIVIPALQSFIADSFDDSIRGAAFGFFYLMGTVGGIGGGAFATVMAGYEFLGIPGWRCALIIMSTLSSIVALLVFSFVVDPRRKSAINHSCDKNSERDALVDKGNANSTSPWLESWTAIKAIMNVKTFQFIVLQGLVGSTPWTAMVFFTFWFELIGFDHKSAAAINSLFDVGSAIGSFIGALIGDRLSLIYPNSGRIMCAQFSAFMGIPCSWLLLRVIPQSVSSYFAFAATMFIMGFTISWCHTAANGPMFAEVVTAKHRTMVYAFDRAFEVSLSSFGAPMAGILSEKIYGYNPAAVDPISGSAQDAYALSRGLSTVMAVPFGLCCLLYTPLYWHIGRFYVLYFKFLKLSMYSEHSGKDSEISKFREEEDGVRIRSINDKKRKEIKL